MPKNEPEAARENSSFPIQKKQRKQDAQPAATKIKRKSKKLVKKDKLNLDQLINNLNQVGLNVIDFDEIVLKNLEKEKEKSEVKKDNLKK